MYKSYTFVDWHRKWNKALGVWELDREMKVLQLLLSDVQNKIIEGAAVQLPDWAKPEAQALNLDSAIKMAAT